MTGTHPTTAPPNTMAAASTYQQLRTHRAVLKLHDAAEALPGVLDEAAAAVLRGDDTGAAPVIDLTTYERAANGRNTLT